MPNERIKCHCGQEFDIPELPGYEYCPHCRCMYTIDGNRAKIGKLESCSAQTDRDRPEVWDDYYNDLVVQGIQCVMEGTMEKMKGNHEGGERYYKDAVIYYARAESLRPNEARPKLGIAEASCNMWQNREHIESILKKVQEAEQLLSEGLSENKIDKFEAKDTIQYLYALCHLGLKNRDLAKKHLRQALSVNPEHSKAAGLLKTLSEDPKKEEPKKSGGCFIATAVYGSPQSPEVTILREFRDDVLLKSRLGKRAVNFYYSFSPFVADYLEQRVFLKKLVKRIFIGPLVYGLRICKAYSQAVKWK